MAKGDDDSAPCNITVGSARKLKRLVDRFDGKGPPSGGPVGRAGGGWTPSNVRAASTSTITGGTFHTPGSGSARIFYLVDGEWTQEAEDVTAYHDLSDKDIEENTALRLSWISGQWWVSEAGCKAETSPIVDSGGA